MKVDMKMHIENEDEYGEEVEDENDSAYEDEHPHGQGVCFCFRGNFKIRPGPHSRERPPLHGRGVCFCVSAT